MKIFLSHAGYDKVLVRSVRKLLPNYISVWIDEFDLIAGEELGQGLRSAVHHKSDFIVIFLSEKAVQSSWVMKELQWALEREKDVARELIIPVFLEKISPDKIPLSLRGRKYLECHGTTERGIQFLADQISNHLALWLNKQFERNKSELENCRRLLKEIEVDIVPGTSHEYNEDYYRYFDRYLRNSRESVLLVGSGFHCAGDAGLKLAKGYLRALTGCAMRHGLHRIEMADPETMTTWLDLVSEFLAPMEKVKISIPTKQGIVLLKDVCLIDSETDSPVVEIMLPVKKIDSHTIKAVDVAGPALFIRGMPARKISKAVLGNIRQLKRDGLIEEVSVAEFRRKFNLQDPSEKQTDIKAYYFAYGSNMLSEQMRVRIPSADIETAKPAVLKGYRLAFNIPGQIFSSTVANVVEDSESDVWGVLYEANHDELIRRMDFYEAVHQDEYHPDWLEVLPDGDHESVTALVYRNETASDSGEPSAGYVARMLQGASGHDLPRDYVQQLEELHASLVYKEDMRP